MSFKIDNALDMMKFAMALAERIIRNSDQIEDSTWNYCVIPIRFCARRDQDEVKLVDLSAKLEVKASGNHRSLERMKEKMIKDMKKIYSKKEKK